ncbi:helix-turn-helix transcriptional regulator [Sporolactobacillus pectinivorans]|uniref:helix-turn-helix transcriptional regulator n=1 Tax=Sporolactobacillus pectinivorans TaxID=1591408 RepID=UPI0023D7EFB9|nr:WYL domain-containing protein [Sporolactobacillus pectinivorans]
MKLPHNRRYEATQFSKRIYLDPSGWFTGHEAVPYLEMIQKAMWDYHWIQIDYQKVDGKIVSREVAPYGLVAKTDFWYLIAKHEDVMRVYRVSRVRNMQITGRNFVFSANFNLSQFWLAWCQEFEGRPALLFSNDSRRKRNFKAVEC